MFWDYLDMWWVKFYPMPRGISKFLFEVFTDRFLTKQYWTFLFINKKVFELIFFKLCQLSSSNMDISILQSLNILISLALMRFHFSSLKSISVMSDSVTPWTAAHQVSLSITNPRACWNSCPSESVMPSNHLILCHPFLLLPSIFPSIRVFSNESALHQVAKISELQL